MVSASELLALAELTGRELLDQVAMDVGMTKPSVPLTPLDTQMPGALPPIGEAWERAAKDLLKHEEELRASTNRALDDWEGEAADQFATGYMPKLYKVLEAQQDAVDDVPGILDGMKKAMEDAKKDADDNEFNATLQVLGVLGGATAGLVVGLFFAETTAPAVISACVVALVGIIFVLLGQIHTTNKTRKERLDGLSKQLGKLKELVDKDHVKTVSPPPDPEITSKGFSYSNFFPED